MAFTGVYASRQCQPYSWRGTQCGDRRLAHSTGWLARILPLPFAPECGCPVSLSRVVGMKCERSSVPSTKRDAGAEKTRTDHLFQHERDSVKRGKRGLSPFFEQPSASVRPRRHGADEACLAQRRKEEKKPVLRMHIESASSLCAFAPLRLCVFASLREIALASPCAGQSRFSCQDAG
jgi:hypothetical protein